MARQNYCGNCGSTQGPFERLWIGNRKTGQWVVTCRIPSTGPDGKRLPDNKRAELASACTSRRDKRYASAQAHHATGS